MIINSGNLQTLYRGFNAAFREGFGQAGADHMPFTLDVTSMTRTEEYGWLGQFPGLKEWVGERVLRGIREHSYTIRNKKFESTVEVERDDIEDDHYGVYAPLFQEMGRSAGAHPCELTFAQLKTGFATACYDGQYFFDTDHPGPGGPSVSNSGGGVGDGVVPARLLADDQADHLPAPARLRPAADGHARRRARVHARPVPLRRRRPRQCRLRPLAARLRVEAGPDTASYEAARVALMGVKGDQDRPLGCHADAPGGPAEPWSMRRSSCSTPNGSPTAPPTSTRAPPS